MKIGDRIRILRKPLMWSSGCSNNCPLYLPFYNGKTTGIVTKKNSSKYNSSSLNIAILIKNVEYGFCISDETRDCFQVIPSNINLNIKLI
jgi:hypothetical protein